MDNVTVTLKTNENGLFTDKGEYQWDAEFSPLCLHHLGAKQATLLFTLQIPHL